MIAPYYEHAGITIYHADAREMLPDILAHVWDIDVLVTDPPYGVNLGSHKAAAETRPQWLKKEGYASYDDTPENFRAIIAPIIEQLIHVCDRAAVFSADGMAWDLPRPTNIGGIYLPAACGRNAWGFANLAHVLLYGKCPDLQFGAKATAILSNESGAANGHPCPKPLGWMKWLLCLVSRPHETILDPFMGSGTTLRAAKDLDRIAIGIEIEERYCEMAADSLRQEVLPFAPTPH